MNNKSLNELIQTTTDPFLKLQFERELRYNQMLVNEQHATKTDALASFVAFHPINKKNPINKTRLTFAAIVFNANIR